MMFYLKREIDGRVDYYESYHHRKKCAKFTSDVKKAFAFLRKENATRVMELPAMPNKTQLKIVEVEDGKID